MRCLFVSLIIVGCLLIFLQASTCEAHGLRRGHRRGGHHLGMPQSASSHAYHHSGHVYLMPQSGYGAYGLPAAKRAYAYGWFGARRRWHKGVHHGYYHKHTQWSFR